MLGDTKGEVPTTQGWTDRHAHPLELSGGSLILFVEAFTTCSYLKHNSIYDGGLLENMVSHGLKELLSVNLGKIIKGTTHLSCGRSHSSY